MERRFGIFPSSCKGGTDLCSACQTEALLKQGSYCLIKESAHVFRYNQRLLENRITALSLYYLCSYGHEMIFIGGEYTERVSSLLVDLYSIQTSMNELDQRSLGEKNVQTSEFCKPIIQDIRNLIIKIRPRFTELVIKAGTKRKPIPVGKIEKSPEHYSIIKGPQFWTLRYGGKDSMIQADLKGLKLLEILLRNKNRDYYPSELLRDAFPPQDGTIQTLSDGESMDEQLSNGDGISSDDAKKIRDRDKKSVERALSKVFGKIDHQELRNHFEGCIQTGTIVCYKPGQSIGWVIS